MHMFVYGFLYLNDILKVHYTALAHEYTHSHGYSVIYNFGLTFCVFLL